MAELNESDLAQKIADGIAAGLQSVAPKKVPVGRYEPRTPFHPKGTPATYAKLTRPCFQNGYALDEALLTDEEIRLLNQVLVPGKYIDLNGIKAVEVVISENGSTKELELRYQNKTADQRSELKGAVRNLKAMLECILDEQGELIAAMPPVQKRAFGLSDEGVAARVGVRK